MGRDDLDTKNMKARKPIFRSIRTRLTVYFCAVFLASMVTVELINVFGLPFTEYDGMWNRARSSAFESFSHLADLKKERIIRWIEQRHIDGEVWSQKDRLKKNTSEILKKTRELKDEGIEGEVLWSRIRKDNSYRTLYSTLNASKDLYRVYDRIDILDRETGIALVSTDEKALGKDHSACTHFVDFVNLPNSSFGNVLTNPEGEYPHFHISRTIEDPDGEAIAVFVMVVSTEDMIKPILSIGEKLGRTGEALLVNRERKILTSLKHNLPDGTSARPLEYRIDAKTAMFAARGEEGIIESLDYRRVPVLAAYRHIRITPDFGWGLIVKCDREELFAPIWEELFYTLLITVIGTVLVFIVTFIMANNISHPLSLLSRTARQVEEGDLEVRAPVITSDEIGIMAGTFNSMIAKIQNWYEELERQVKTRTAQLNSMNDDLIREITERKKAEKDLKTHRDRLEEMVEERTTNLIIANEQLQEEIIERLRIEEALAAEKKRLDVTLASIADGVITTDLRGRVMLINKTAQHLSGWTRSDAAGRNLNEVFKLTDNEMGRGFEDSGCEILDSRNGVRRTIEYSLAPIINEDSTTIGSVLAFRDVTEKKNMEEELLRTGKLDSLSLLAGGIAHDFNNILTAMLSSISLSKVFLSQGKIMGVIDILTEAEKAAVRAKALTQQLLTFSRGGKPIKDKISLAKYLRESVKFALSGSNVKCEYSLPDDLWNVEVDAGQINQVFNNLTINAVQSMPDGGTIEVAAENQILERNNSFGLKEGKHLKLSVKDYGVGISEEHLSKIFDPYFTTKQQGSGLGLASTYSIIKNHDGHIRVESEVGNGTTIFIYLPACEDEIEIEKEPKKRQHNGVGRLILMDDDESILNSVSVLLEHFGYEVAVARDGREMLELYQEAKEAAEPYQAVIMDLTIPGGMGGKEAIKRLIEFDHEARAIVSSGYSSDAMMSEYKKYGFMGVVTKPYNIDKLMDTLRHVINSN